MYKTGIETKQNILNTARKLFYEHGFRNTPISLICDKSDTKPGTLTYYFPHKVDFLPPIYSGYMSRCSDYIHQLKPGLPSGAHHLYTVLLYYENLYADTNNIRFHKEIMSIASMNAWFHDSRALIESFSGSNTSGMDEDFYALCVKADNAIRRELNLEFMQKGNTSSLAVKELLVNIYRLNAKLFNVDEVMVIHTLDEAYDFVQLHPAPSIQLLRMN